MEGCEAKGGGQEGFEGHKTAEDLPNLVPRRVLICFARRDAGDAACCCDALRL